VFDVVAAQQREVAEGIPVAMQKAQWEADQAKRKAEAEARKNKKDDTETEAEKKVKALQKQLQQAQLEYEIQYEPQLRAIKEHAEDLQGLNKEVTFDAAVKGMDEAYKKGEELKGTIDKQNAAIDAQKGKIEGQQDAIQAIRDANDALADSSAVRFQIESLTTAELQKQMKAYNDMAPILEQLFGIKIAPVGQQAPDISQTQNDPTGLIGRAWGYADGGVTGGGVVKMGERGSELAVLPAGTRVIPHSAMQAASMSKTYNDTYNVYGANQPANVVAAIRRERAWERLRGGRG
jgi:hypothetical protein